MDFIFLFVIALNFAVLGCYAEPKILCKDTHRNCELWKKLKTLNCQYRSTAKICANSCGNCVTYAETTTIKEPTTSCEDKDTLCQTYKGLGWCSRGEHQMLMERKCAKSCGKCGTNAAGSTDPNFVPVVGCGARFVEHDDVNSHHGFRIVGGSDAVRGSLPWIVSIQYKYIRDHFCGGTIIGKRWILTAAHCFKNGKIAINIIAGEHNLRNNEGSEQSIQVDPNGFYCHSGYNSKSHDNDICLLKLSQDLRFDQFTQPACLPKIANIDRDYRPGDNVIISGWGTLSFRGSSPNTLQMIDVPLISTQDCNSREGYRGKILSSMICAGELSGGVDACQGDSGGPLVKKVDNKWTVLGVVSWGIGCGRKNAPGVYTRVVKFEEWIKDIMSKN